MNESSNPFRFSEPVPVDELLDRDEEARILLDRAKSGNNSRLVAPRRYGKTSLLRGSWRTHVAPDGPPSTSTSSAF